MDYTKQVLGSLIRMGMFVVAGFLVSRGMITQELADSWVSEITALALGAVLIGVAALWRWLNLRYNFGAFFTALNHEPPQTDQQLEQAVVEVKKEVRADATTISY